jgi:hypothetical protein
MNETVTPDHGPAPMEFLATPIVVGQWCLSQEASSRRTFLSYGGYPPYPEDDVIEADEFFIPDWRRDDIGYDWMLPVGGGAAVPHRLRGFNARLGPTTREIARVPQSAEWQAFNDRLTAQNRGLRWRTNVLSVARVLWKCQQKGEPRPTYEEIARRALVDRHLVPGYLRALRDFGPALFPLLVGAREATLATGLGPRAGEWLEMMMRLRARNLAKDRHAIEREFLFRAFKREHEPNVSSLSDATWLPNARVKKLLLEKAHEEKVAKLADEFGDRLVAWRPILDSLRDLSDASSFAIGCGMIAGVLAGPPVSKHRVSQWSGVARSTLRGLWDKVIMAADLEWVISFMAADE